MRANIFADTRNDLATARSVEGASDASGALAALQSASLAAMSAPVAPRLSAMSVAFDVLVLLEFDAALPFSPVPAIGQFTVKADGVAVKVEEVSVAENGHTLVLTLADGVKAGATVSVAYADVSAADDRATLQGMNGADVANFQAQTKVEGVVEDNAPRLESMSVVFDELVLLQFDRPLATEGLPAIEQFTVTVDGVAAKVARVSVAENGHTFVLILDKPVKAGALVTVDYADVSEGDDASALQGADGADVANFQAQTKVEGEQGPAPQLQSMSVAFGELVLLDFDAPLPFDPVPAISQFTVKVNGIVAKVERVSVAENGHTLVLTLEQPVKNGALVTVTYTDVSAEDDDVTLQGADGADVANFEAQAKAEGGPGEPAPQLQSMAVKGDQLTLRFDADLATQDLPSLSQFTVEVGGVTMQVVDLAVGNSGDVLILTLAMPVSLGASVALAYRDVSAQDDQNTLQGVDGSDVGDFNAEAQAGGAAPLFDTMTVRGDKVSLAFDAALSADGLPSVDQFTLTLDGAELQIESLALSEDGRGVVLSLAEPVQPGATVALTYTDVSGDDDAATLQGADGADVADFEAEALAQSAVPAMTAMTVRGDQVTLKFDAPLSAQDLPSLAQFTIMVEGAQVEMTSIAVSETGDLVSLRLEAPVAVGALVQLAYKDVSAQDDPATLQGLDGVDVADFTAEGLGQSPGEPPVVVEAVADGRYVRLVLDQLIDSAHLPPPTAFLVEVDGEAAEVFATSLGAGEHELVLILKAPAGFGQTISVSYVDPSQGDDELALQTQGGVDADGFEALAVQNDTPAPAPKFESASVSGTSLVLNYDMALDANHGPDRAMFWVYVDGEQIAVNRAVVSGSTVTLTLSAAVTSAQSVRVSYFDDTYGEDDAYGIQSRDGADADTVLDRTVAHRSSASVLHDDGDISLVGQGVYASDSAFA